MLRNMPHNILTRKKEEDKWLIIRNAWLNGWDKHRCVYLEM